MKQRDIFIEALQKKDGVERDTFLVAACGDDIELRNCVEELLAEHQKDESFFLDAPPPGLGATADMPAITEKPGTVIGPYKLLQQIGEGGMGVVYMAEQKEPVKRRVALKIIKPGMDTRQVIARFEAERQALAMMDHPNIAKVLDAGATDSGRPYFVMELVNGISVTQYCDDQHLTPKERLELFLPICQAVQHAHQKGIIHRDLKPSNVMIALYDDQAVPKVIDFGVAKATSQTLTEKTMFTQLGQIVGTLEYMSPEQAQRNQLDIDTRSDIYSLGVLLYELLTGDTPFDRQRLRSAAFDEMLRIIREEEPLKPSTKVSGSESLASIAANRKIEPAKLSVLVRGELDWIVMKALEKDRGRRYATATSFAEDIQHYLNDEAVVACPPSARYRFRKFVRRNRPLIATGALVTAALVLGLVGTTWQAIRANNQSIRANNQSVRATSAERLAKQRLEREQETRKQVSLERDKALAAEKAAESRFQIATDAVERYLNEVTNDPELQAGDFRELRRRLLESAVPFYEQLIEEKPQDRRQRLSQGLAHHSLWGLEFYCFSNYEAARSQMEQSLEIFEELLGEDSEDDGVNDEQIRQGLAACHGNLGLTLRRLGEAKLARDHEEQGLELDLRLQQDYPKNVHHRISAGNSYGNLGQTEKAVEIFEGLYEEFPASSVIRDKLAWFLHNKSDLESQQKSLEIREKLASDFPSAANYRWHVAISLTSLGRWYHKKNDWEQARQHHERALEIRSSLAQDFSRPDYQHLLAETELELGRLFIEKAQSDEANGHFEQALRILEPLVNQMPQVPQYREKLISVQCELGQTHYRQGEWQAALEMLQKADELRDGGINWNRFVMAMAHWQLGDMEEARTVYWDAVSRTAVGNDNKELQGFRTEAEQVLGISSEERVAFEVDQLTKFIEVDPDHLEALRGRADIYKNMKQWAKAIDEYSNIIRLKSDDANACRDRYFCYRGAGEYDSALADITRAIELRPDNEWFYEKRASLRIYNLSQFREGIADCEQTFRVNPKNRLAYYHRAWAYRELKEYVAAIEDFSRAIDLQPNAGTYHARAQTYRRMQNDEAAIEDWSRAIDLQPNAGRYHARAIAYRELENYEAALADLSRAIELAPKNGAYYVARARVRIVHLKKNREGIADCDAALRINPNNFNALLHRARAHARLGEHDAAITDAAAGLKFSADSVIRRNVLAEVLRTSGGSETLDEFKELKEYFAAVESDTPKTQE